MQSLQDLSTKLKEMCTVQDDISGVPKHQWLTPEILSAILDDCLRNDNELTASKLKAKFLQQYANFHDVSLSKLKG